MKERIPISVGIIGHLDAIVTAEHVDKITELFNDLNRFFPNSPVCLFSQLAEGSDTAIAKLFIDLKNDKKRSYELIVPIPFDIKDYETRFDEDEKKTFNDLLSQAYTYFVLDHKKKLNKNELYRLCGKFVADSSIILIALCETDSVQKKGGTADLINYKTTGSFDEYAVEGIFDMEGMPIILDCERVSHKTKRNIELGTSSLFTKLNGDRNKSILKALQKIEELNKTIIKLSGKSIIESEKQLFPSSKGLNPSNVLIRRYYSITNAQALYHQKFYNFIIGLLFIMGPIIIGCFEWYKHMGQSKIMLGATITLIIIAFSFFLYSKKKKNHTIFLENRILAESLRIQFFWNLGNVKENVSNYILRIHNTEYNWIKHILLAIYGISYTSEDSAISTEEIIHYWIKNQNRYFKSKVDKLMNTITYYEYISKVMLLLGFILIALLFTFYKYADQKLGNYPIVDWIILCISVFFGSFALAKAYLEKKGFNQIVNQYTLMKSIYEKSQKKITQIQEKVFKSDQKSEAIRKIYFAAGKEALIENGSWYLIFKKKEPEVEGFW